MRAAAVALDSELSAVAPADTRVRLPLRYAEYASLAAAFGELERTRRAPAPPNVAAQRALSTLRAIVEARAAVAGVAGNAVRGETRASALAGLAAAVHGALGEGEGHGQRLSS